MKIIRTTTVPESLNIFCRGLLRELREKEGYKVVAVSSPGSALYEIKARESVKIYAVPMERHISPLKDLNSLLRMIKVFHTEKPDMVHSMTPKAGLVSMMAAWITRVPVRVHTFTGLIFPTSTGLKKYILMATDWLTCACATHIIPEGEGVKNDLLNNGITHKPLKVLGYGNVRGIDLKRFNPELLSVQTDAAIIRKEDFFTFIFIGRLVKDKGVNELVRAFSQLNVQYPKTRLLLVGAYEEKLDPLSSETFFEINNNKNIEAVGPQKDVRPWLAASDVFVFPSYREGFPNVVIEAGAMELPSIVTDINGSREIIIEGENGIIIPSKNVNELYKAMEYMLTHKDVRRYMANKTRSLVASRYEQSFVRNCLKRYYKEILCCK